MTFYSSRMSEKLYTAAEVAARFGVAVETIARWRRDGILRGVLLGRRVFRYSEAALRAAERKGARRAEALR